MLVQLVTQAQSKQQTELLCIRDVDSVSGKSSPDLSEHFWAKTKDKSFPGRTSKWGKVQKEIPVVVLSALPWQMLVAVPGVGPYSLDKNTLQPNTVQAAMPHSPWLPQRLFLQRFGSVGAPVKHLHIYWFVQPPKHHHNLKLARGPADLETGSQGLENQEWKPDQHFSSCWWFLGRDTDLAGLISSKWYKIIVSSLESQAKIADAQSSFPDSWKCVCMDVKDFHPLHSPNTFFFLRLGRREVGLNSSQVQSVLWKYLQIAMPGECCKRCAPSALSCLAPNFLISLSDRGCAAKRRSFNYSFPPSSLMKWL